MAWEYISGTEQITGIRSAVRHKNRIYCGAWESITWYYDIDTGQTNSTGWRNQYNWDATPSFVSDGSYIYAIIQTPYEAGHQTYCYIYRINPETGQSTNYARLSASNGTTGSVAYNGKIYFIGGMHWDAYSEGYIDTNRFTEYDPNSNTFTNLTPIPNARSYFTPVVLNNKIYCIGGVYSGSTLRSNVDVYDFNLKAWNVISAASPNQPRLKAATFTDGKSIYMAGGSVTNASGSHVQSVEKYDADTNKWSYIDPLPDSTREWPIGTYNNYYVYVVPVDERVGPTTYNTRIARNYFPPPLPPTVSSPSPTSGKVNELYPITLSWRFNGTDGSTQASALVQWQDITQGTDKEPVQQVNVSGANESAEIAAGTWSSGRYRWRVMVTSTNGLSSDFTAWYTLSTVKIANASPQGGFQNDQEPITLSWQVAGANQRSATVQWRNTASPGTVNTIAVSNSTTSVTIPANTLPNGSFQWRVSAIDEYGDDTGYTEWYTISTIEQTPGRPTNLNPNDTVERGNLIISFTWRHNSPDGIAQRAYQIQFTYNNSANESDFQTVVPKTETSSQIYNAPANSIVPTDPTSKIGWRVRTWNSDDIASPWSDVAWFIVEVAPSPPVWVSVSSGSNRPLCRWTSSVQISFELQVLEAATRNIKHESGVVFSQDPVYLPNQYFENGNYIFRVRVSNSRGVWSDWAELSVAISAVKKVWIELTGSSGKNYGQLNWTTRG